MLVDTENDVLTLWDKEEKKKLRALSYSTISHGFEEMIKWTEEGKYGIIQSIMNKVGNNDNYLYVVVSVDYHQVL